MRFALTDEQQGFRDLVREVLDRECPPAVVREYWSDGPRPGTERVWATLAEVGATGVLVPEARGGLGLDETYLVLLMEEAGYAGLPGPLAETVGVAAPVLAARGAGPATPGWPDVDGVLAGTVRVAIDVAGAGIAAHARDAHLLLVGGWGGHEPVRRAVTDPADRRAVLAIDRTRELARFERGAAEVLDLDPARLRRFWLRGVVGHAALLVGLARRMLDITVDYVRQRHQFGVPIGSFQAVKHHLADATLAVELAGPAVRFAGYSLAAGTATAARDVSVAKVLASDAAQLLATTAIQCHGAMGYTEESDLHLFAKRAWALAPAWGDASWHRAAVADDLGLARREEDTRR